MSETSETANQGSSVRQVLTDRFRCPDYVADFEVSSGLSHDSGFFRMGVDAVCYGRCSSGIPAKLVIDPLHDVSPRLTTNGSRIQLPFNPAHVIDNLRCERYVAHASGTGKLLPAKRILRNTYYLARPFLPVVVRRHLQKLYLRGWDSVRFPTWPVDRTVENLCERLLILSLKSQKAERVPFIWFWPKGAQSCAMVTHDVETSSGVDFCSQLMDLDDSFGVKTSFQIVPEKRYTVSKSFLECIRARGFEVNIHDLNHDGHLFRGREEFLRRAERINHYAKQFGARGFRSAALYRNVDWYDALDFSYDMSIPNVAHLDPQRGGCCTVMPFFVGKILELPLTATQDYSLFHILNDFTMRLWKEQISLIRGKHGLISFNIHPDYIIAKAARRAYVELLHYLSKLRSQEETWIALPGEVASWWRMRSEMNLVNVGGSWRIEGKGKEQARVAYAMLVNNTVAYEIERTAPNEGAESERGIKNDSIDEDFEQRSRALCGVRTGNGLSG
jgi:hypothetical protein